VDVGPGCEGQRCEYGLGLVPYIDSVAFFSSFGCLGESDCQSKSQTIFPKARNMSSMKELVQFQCLALYNIGQLLMAHASCASFSSCAAPTVFRTV
jgi:hypothetical protein